MKRFCPTEDQPQKKFKRESSRLSEWRDMEELFKKAVETPLPCSTFCCPEPQIRSRKKRKSTISDPPNSHKSNDCTKSQSGSGKDLTLREIFGLPRTEYPIFVQSTEMITPTQSNEEGLLFFDENNEAPVTVNQMDSVDLLFSSNRKPSLGLEDSTKAFSSLNQTSPSLQETPIRENHFETNGNETWSSYNEPKNSLLTWPKSQLRRKIDASSASPSVVSRLPFLLGTEFNRRDTTLDRYGARSISRAQCTDRNISDLDLVDDSSLVCEPDQTEFSPSAWLCRRLKKKKEKVESQQDIDGPKSSLGEPKQDVNSKVESKSCNHSELEVQPSNKEAVMRTTNEKGTLGMQSCSTHSLTPLRKNSSWNAHAFQTPQQSINWNSPFRCYKPKVVSPSIDQSLKGYCHSQDSLSSSTVRSNSTNDIFGPITRFEQREETNYTQMSIPTPRELFTETGAQQETTDTCQSTFASLSVRDRTKASDKPHFQKAQFPMWPQKSRFTPARWSSFAADHFSNGSRVETQARFFHIRYTNSQNGLNQIETEESMKNDLEHQIPKLQPRKQTWETNPKTTGDHRKHENFLSVPKEREKCTNSKLVSKFDHLERKYSQDSDFSDTESKSFERQARVVYRRPQKPKFKVDKATVEDCVHPYPFCQAHPFNPHQSCSHFAHSTLPMHKLSLESHPQSIHSHTCSTCSARTLQHIQSTPYQTIYSPNCACSHRSHYAHSCVSSQSLHHSCTYCPPHIIYVGSPSHTHLNSVHAPHFPFLSREQSATSFGTVPRISPLYSLNLGDCRVDDACEIKSDIEMTDARM